MKRSISRACWAVLLMAGATACVDQTVTSARPAAAPRPTLTNPSPNATRYGIVVGGVQPAQRDSAFNAIEESGVGWIKLTAYWNQTEPNPDRVLYLDNLKEDIRRARIKGIKVLLTVHATPWWAQGCQTAADPVCQNTSRPPADAYWNTWGSFMERLTNELSTYPYDVQAYSVWNEPNDVAFLNPWPGQTAFGAYYNLLRYAEPYIRAHGALVVAGELAQGGSDGDNWPQQLAVQQQYWDVLAIHQYNASTCTEHDVHRIRAQLNGMNRPIWVTEAGVPNFVHSDTEKAYNVAGYLTEMSDSVKNVGKCSWDTPESQSYPDEDWNVTFIWYMWPTNDYPYDGMVTDLVTYQRRAAFYCLKAFAWGTAKPQSCVRTGDY